VDEYLASFHSGTRQTPQAPLNHLFRSQRADRLFLELVITKVLLQWVVILAWSPMTSIVLIPCNSPRRDGQSLIFSINRKISTRFR